MAREVKELKEARTNLENHLDELEWEVSLWQKCYNKMVVILLRHDPLINSIIILSTLI